MFIARISRGRTVREFVAGAAGPTAVTLWFTVLAVPGSPRVVWRTRHDADGNPTVDTEASLFAVLEALPGGAVLCGRGILIVLFFVTSSDSGSPW